MLAYQPDGNQEPEEGAGGDAATVYVVDDDDAGRHSLHWLIESVGLQVESFARPSDFFDTCDSSKPGCLVLDLRLPEMSGLELQERLRSQGMRIPIIMITAYGDVPTAVRAMKAGAVDFVEKPFNDQALLDRIQQCIELDLEMREVNASYDEIKARYETLTKRERQVMSLLISGKSNKPIGELLGISPKTVEVHRAKVMEKMAAESIVFLVHMANICGLREDPQLENDPLVANLLQRIDIGGRDLGES